MTISADSLSTADSATLTADGSGGSQSAIGSATLGAFTAGAGIALLDPDPRFMVSALGRNFTVQ